jgi:type I restriction enzyme S subunit
MALKSASPAALQILDEIGLGDLPSGWDIIRIEELLSQDRGISVGVMYPGDHDPAGIPLIKAGDLASSRINPNPEFYITPQKHHEYRRTQLGGGELLISLVGDVGRCAIVPAEMAGWNAARAIAVLRFADPSVAGFVRVCLMSAPLQHLMQAWATTTVQATLNLKEIRQIPLPWPPNEQRKAIAHILGTLDDKIELNRSMNETLEAIVRALFKSWFIDFDPVRAKAEGRALGLPKPLTDLFPDSFEDSELGEIPKGWKVCPFTESVEVIGGGTPKTSVAEYWEGDLPWFSIVDAPVDSNIFVINTEKRITQKGLNNSAARLLPEGATIISARGTVGKLAIVGVPMAMNQSCYGLCGIEAGAAFTYFAARSLVLMLKQNSHGSVFDTITRDTLAGVSLIMPTRAVLNAFEKVANPFMQRIKSNLFESRSLSTLRDLLLPKLTSGELRVAEQIVAEAAS